MLEVVDFCAELDSWLTGEFAMSLRSLRERWSDCELGAWNWKELPRTTSAIECKKRDHESFNLSMTSVRTYCIHCADVCGAGGQRARSSSTFVCFLQICCIKIDRFADWFCSDPAEFCPHLRWLLLSMLYIHTYKHRYFIFEEWSVSVSAIAVECAGRC